jgi:selenocysteine lyase/cysteine desulfurase
MSLGPGRKLRVLHLGNVANYAYNIGKVLQTDSADVFSYGCNGHGAWEACIVNLVPPGGTVLIPGTGHFSESWAVQTEALGRKVVRTPWVEGLPIDPAVVTAALRADTAREIVAVFVVHTDTSSGITSDVSALRAALDAADHPALFVVDVVASLGAEPFDFDAQRVDAAVGASQKGLMCPPGIGFLACNAAAFEAAQRRLVGTDRGFLLVQRRAQRVVFFQPLAQRFFIAQTGAQFLARQDRAAAAATSAADRQRLGVGALGCRHTGLCGGVGRGFGGRLGRRRLRLHGLKHQGDTGQAHGQRKHRREHVHRRPRKGECRQGRQGCE